MLFFKLRKIASTLGAILRCVFPPFGRSTARLVEDHLLRMNKKSVHPEQVPMFFIGKRRRATTGVFLKCLLLIIPLAVVAVSQRLLAQPAFSKSMIKVVLVSGGASGLSAGEADSFFLSLRAKLSEFTSLSVLLKADFAKGLSKENRAALEKCSDVSCVQTLAAKAGFQRVLLCRITKKNSTYQFQSDEFDAKKPQKLSGITDNAVCASAGDVDNFIRKIAIRVGQTVTHDASIPETLQESKSNLWWYIGSAAAVGVAAGVYVIVEHKKQNPSTPASLPLPPNFP